MPIFTRASLRRTGPVADDARQSRHRLADRAASRVRRQLMPEPGALSLRVLPRLDENLSHAPAAEPARPRTSAAHRAVAGRLPRRRVRRDRLASGARTSSGHPWSSMSSIRARDALAPAPAQDRPQDSAGANGDRARCSRCKSLRRRPVSSAISIGAEQLRAAEMRARRIERRDPAAKLLGRASTPARRSSAARRSAIERRLLEQSLEQRAQIEPGPADDDRRASGRARLVDPLVGRTSPTPPPNSALGRIDDVDPDVRNARALVARRLRRADVEAAIDLPRIGADDRRRRALRRATSATALFPAAVGPQMTRIGESLSAGRSAAQSRPRRAARSSRGRARRARAASCRAAR